MLFRSAEKHTIAENFGRLWEIDPQQASEVLNDVLSADEEGLLADLEDFDFDL